MSTSRFRARGRADPAAGGADPAAGCSIDQPPVVPALLSHPRSTASIAKKWMETPGRSIPGENGVRAGAGRGDGCSSTRMRVRTGAPKCRRSELADERSPIARNVMRDGLEGIFGFLSPKTRIGDAKRGGLELLLAPASNCAIQKKSERSALIRLTIIFML